MNKSSKYEIKSVMQDYNSNHELLQVSGKKGTVIIDEDGVKKVTISTIDLIFLLMSFSSSER